MANSVVHLKKGSHTLMWDFSQGKKHFLPVFKHLLLNHSFTKNICDFGCPTLHITGGSQGQVRRALGQPGLVGGSRA